MNYYARRERKILILNKTRSPRERYMLITSPMGCFGDPDYYPTHNYSIANGVDRGNGYQSYESITYFLRDNKYVPFEARHNLIMWLRKNGYEQYIKQEAISVANE